MNSLHLTTSYASKNPPAPTQELTPSMNSKKRSFPSFSEMVPAPSCEAKTLALRSINEPEQKRRKLADTVDKTDTVVQGKKRKQEQENPSLEQNNNPEISSSENDDDPEIFPDFRESKKQKITNSSVNLPEEASSSNELASQNSNSFLQDYPWEILSMIMENLDFNDLASVSQTCKGLRQIADHTWGVFRRRDGLNFEFQMATGRSNSDQYLLCHSVINGFAIRDYRRNKIWESLATRFEDCAVFLHSKFPAIWSHVPCSLNSDISSREDIEKIAAEIAEAAGKFAGESLIHAYSTPIKEENHTAILDHYIFACVNGIPAASYIAWCCFQVFPTTPTFSLENPAFIKLQELVLLGADQGDFRALELLLEKATFLIDAISENRANYPQVMAAKAKTLYTKNKFQEAVILYEAAFERYFALKISLSPKFLVEMANALLAAPSVDVNVHLTRAAEIYNLLYQMLITDEKLIFKLGCRIDSVMEKAATLNVNLDNPKRAAELYLIVGNSQKVETGVREACLSKASEQYESAIKKFTDNGNPVPREILQVAAHANLKASNLERAIDLYGFLLKDANMPREILEGAAIANYTYAVNLQLKDKKRPISFKKSADLFKQLTNRYMDESGSIPIDILEMAAESNYNVGIKLTKNTQTYLTEAANFYTLLFNSIQANNWEDFDKSVYYDKLHSNAITANFKIGNFDGVAKICNLLTITKAPLLDMAAQSNFNIKNFDAASKYYITLSNRKAQYARERAISKNKKISNAKPKIAKHLEFLGRVAESLYKAKQYDHAVKLYRDLFEQHNQQQVLIPPTVLQLAAAANYKAGQFINSSDYYNHLLSGLEEKQIAPNKKLLRQAADANHKAQNFPRANALYHESLELYEKFMKHQAQIETPIKTRMLLKVANVYFTLGNFQRVVELSDLLIQRYLDNNILTPKEVLDIAAKSNFKTGNFQKAAELFDFHIFRYMEDSSPVPIQVLSLASSANFKTGNFQRVVELSELIMQKYPDKKTIPTVILDIAAQANFKTGNFPKTIELSELIMQKYQDEKTIPTEILDVAANAYFKTGNFLKADQLYDLLILRYEKDKTPLEILDNAAVAKLCAGNPEIAFTQLASWVD